MIPTAALPHRIQVEPYQGTTGTGQPVYGDPVNLRARLLGKRRAVRNSEGVDVIADATATIRPGHTFPNESRVIREDGRIYEVLGIAESVELRRAHNVELILQGPRGDG